MDRHCHGECCCCPLTLVNSAERAWVHTETSQTFTDTQIHQTHIYTKYKWEHAILNYTQPHTLFVYWVQSHVDICSTLQLYSTYVHVWAKTYIHWTLFTVTYCMYSMLEKNWLHIHMYTALKLPHLNPQGLQFSIEPGLWWSLLRVSFTNNIYHQNRYSFSSFFPSFFSVFSFCPFLSLLHSHVATHHVSCSLPTLIYGPIHHKALSKWSNRIR